MGGRGGGGGGAGAAGGKAGGEGGVGCGGCMDGELCVGGLSVVLLVVSMALSSGDFNNAFVAIIIIFIESRQANIKLRLVS